MRLAEFSHFRSKFQREDEWSTLSPRQIVWGWSDGWDIMRHWPARQVKDSPRHKGAQGERRLNAGWLLWTVLCISQVAGTIMKTAHVFFPSKPATFFKDASIWSKGHPTTKVRTKKWCIFFWLRWRLSFGCGIRVDALPFGRGTHGCFDRSNEIQNLDKKKTRRWKGWPKIYTWWKLVHQLDTPKKLFTLR